MMFPFTVLYPLQNVSSYLCLHSLDVSLLDVRAACREVVASLVRLKSHHIRTENAIHNLGFRWQDIEQVFLRERCVQEPTNVDIDVHVTSPLPQKQRQEHQMVIMDPDAVSVLHTSCDRGGKCLVCFLIGSRCGSVEQHFVKLMVKQRPDRRICRIRFSTA